MAGPKGVRASMRGPEEEAGWELRQGGRCRLPDTQVENRAARWRARMRGGDALDSRGGSGRPPLPCRWGLEAGLTF